MGLPVSNPNHLRCLILTHYDFTVTETADSVSMIYVPVKMLTIIAMAIVSAKPKAGITYG